MKKIRGTLGAGFLLLPLLFGSMPAQADSNYPSRAINFLVPFSPGSGPDTLARNLSITLSAELGENMVVENRPGAGGNIGMQLLAKAEPNGYTIGIASNGFSINPSLYKNLPFDSIQDFERLCLVSRGSMVLVARPSLEVKSLQDLMERSRSKELTYSSPGNGTPHHLAGALLQKMSGAKLLHVPYSGQAGAMVASLSGEVDLAFLALQVAIPHIQAGKLTPIAVSAINPTKLLPGVPTLDSLGVKGFDVQFWFGLMAPAGLPKQVSSRLVQACELAVKDPKLAESLSSSGLDLDYLSPEAFTDLIKSDIAKWADVIKEAKITAN